MSFSLQSVSAWISSRLSKTCDTAPVHTRIHLYSNTHTHKLNYKLNYLGTPSTSWKCLMQTLNMTDHKHNNTQAQTGKGKQQRKKEKKKAKTTHQRQYRIQQVIDKQTQTNTQTIEPQVPAASPTHAAKPEKQRYMVSIQNQKKNHFTTSVWIMLRGAEQPRKMEKLCRNMEERNPILCASNIFWHNNGWAKKKKKKLTAWVQN